MLEKKLLVQRREREKNKLDYVSSCEPALLSIYVGRDERDLCNFIFFSLHLSVS